MKALALRRADSCVSCTIDLPAGTRAYWDATTRTVTCSACAGGGGVSPPAEAGNSPDVPVQRPLGAGASAQREFDRRAGRREAAVRAAHPKLGGLLLALFDDPASTRVWAQGARGERAVAAKLDELEGEHVTALHDRSMLRTERSALTSEHRSHRGRGERRMVVDAKTHRGTLQVRRSGGLFTPRVEKLYIGGRDKTSLLDGLARQVSAVEMQLSTVGATVPVRGALCFVGTELPWFGESIRGVPLVGRRGLAKLLKRPGDLTRDDREALAAFLAGRFPSAT